MRHWKGVLLVGAALLLICSLSADTPESSSHPGTLQPYRPAPPSTSKFYKRSYSNVEEEDEEDGEAVSPGSAESTGPLALTLYWQKECGCTGMHEEAVSLLHAMHLYPPKGFKLKLLSNPCREKCGRPKPILDFLETIERNAGISSSANDIVVVHVAFRGVCGVDYGAREHSYRISRTMYESDSLKSSAVRDCNRKFYQEVWVPTAFNMESFAKAGVDKSKLYQLPEAIDTDVYDPALYRTAAARDRYYPFFKSEDDVDFAAMKYKVKFYTVFKWEKRKNWQGLFEAFIKEFDREKDNVALFVKTHKAWEGDPATDLEEYEFSPVTVESSPDVFLMERRMATDQLAFLYANMDCFVLPTHGEGWGLPTIEAMAMELPVITTDWGGTTEFANKDNAYMIKVDKLEPAFGGDDQNWAVPSVDDLRRLMRKVYDNLDDARAKGQQARKDVVAKYSKKALARQLSDKLGTVKDKVIEHKHKVIALAKEQARQRVRRRMGESMRKAGETELWDRIRKRLNKPVPDGEEDEEGSMMDEDMGDVDEDTVKKLREWLAAYKAHGPALP